MQRSWWPNWRSNQQIFVNLVTYSSSDGSKSWSQQKVASHWKSLCWIFLLILRSLSWYLGIKDWGVGQIDHSKWTSLDTNEWLLKKVATCKDHKFGDVVSAFSRNYDPQLRNQVKADLVAYHEDQEVFHWWVMDPWNILFLKSFFMVFYTFYMVCYEYFPNAMNVTIRIKLGWPKYELEFLNAEEKLWDMQSSESTMRKGLIEEKVVAFCARYPYYFCDKICFS